MDGPGVFTQAGGLKYEVGKVEKKDNNRNDLLFLERFICNDHTKLIESEYGSTPYNVMTGDNPFFSSLKSKRENLSATCWWDGAP